MQLYNGDCLEIMKDIPDNTIDCIVTSPPYNLGGDFHACYKGTRLNYGAYNSYDDNLPEEDYQNWQIKILNELFRISKENAYCFYVHKERIKNNRVISPLSWIEKSKWICSQSVILDMSSTANVDKRRFFPTFETLYVLCKNEESKLNNQYCLTSVWKVHKTLRKISGHPATFDIQIPINCILAASKEDEIVLDPFMGSGTTGVACRMHNRNFIGIEIDKKYFDIAQNRINGTEIQKEYIQGELF